MAQFGRDSSYPVEPFLFETLRTSKSSREPHITRSTFLSLAQVNFAHRSYENTLNYIDSTLYMLRLFPHNATLLKTIRLQGRCFAGTGRHPKLNEGL